MSIRRFISFCVIITFFLSSLGPFPKAHADSILDLPAAGVMVNLSPAYEPVMIKGLTVHKDNPFLFDFIVDVGQDKLSGAPLKKEGEKLIKYFLASLTIPDKDVWVNLSPYEKNRMIPEALGQTDMGRDLLEQDYILKQITASLIYPEKQLGKSFWDKVYAKSQQMYGTTQIPVNTFNKVWIMADRAEVFEHNQTAFVVDSHLKVMLEEDYLALQKQLNNMSFPNVSVGNPNTTHTIASQIVKRIILPELEKEVNTGKNFANLRQIFNSIILSSWYKRSLKEALLNQVYADKSKVKGINLNDLTIKEQIYQQYLKAYKKGVFNYIKEDVNTANGQSFPRKYFSGGVSEDKAASPAMTHDPATLVPIENLAQKAGRLFNITALASTTAAMVTQAQNNELAELIKRSLEKTNGPDALRQIMTQYFNGNSLERPFFSLLSSSVMGGLNEGDLVVTRNAIIPVTSGMQKSSLSSVNWSNQVVVLTFQSDKSKMIIADVNGAMKSVLKDMVAELKQAGEPKPTNVAGVGAIVQLPLRGFDGAGRPVFLYLCAEFGFVIVNVSGQDYLRLKEKAYEKKTFKDNLAKLIIRLEAMAESNAMTVTQMIDSFSNKKNIEEFRAGMLTDAPLRRSYIDNGLEYEYLYNPQEVFLHLSGLVQQNYNFLRKQSEITGFEKTGQPQPAAIFFNTSLEQFQLMHPQSLLSPTVDPSARLHILRDPAKNIVYLVYVASKTKLREDFHQPSPPDEGGGGGALRLVTNAGPRPVRSGSAAQALPIEELATRSVAETSNAMRTHVNGANHSEGDSQGKLKARIEGFSGIFSASDLTAQLQQRSLTALMPKGARVFAEGDFLVISVVNPKALVGASSKVKVELSGGKVTNPEAIAKAIWNPQTIPVGDAVPGSDAKLADKAYYLYSTFLESFVGDTKVLRQRDFRDYVAEFAELYHGNGLNEVLECLGLLVSLGLAETSGNEWIIKRKDEKAAKQALGFSLAMTVKEAYELVNHAAGINTTSVRTNIRDVSLARIAAILGITGDGSKELSLANKLIIEAERMSGSTNSFRNENIAEMVALMGVKGNGSKQIKLVVDLIANAKKYSNSESEQRNEFLARIAILLGVTGDGSEQLKKANDIVTKAGAVSVRPKPHRLEAITEIAALIGIKGDGENQLREAQYLILLGNQFRLEKTELFAKITVLSGIKIDGKQEMIDVARLVNESGRVNGIKSLLMNLRIVEITAYSKWKDRQSRAMTASNPLDGAVFKKWNPRGTKLKKNEAVSLGIYGSKRKVFQYQVGRKRGLFWITKNADGGLSIQDSHGTPKRLLAGAEGNVEEGSDSDGLFSIGALALAETPGKHEIFLVCHNSSPITFSAIEYVMTDQTPIEYLNLQKSDIDYLKSKNVNSVDELRKRDIKWLSALDTPYPNVEFLRKVRHALNVTSLNGEKPIEEGSKLDELYSRENLPFLIPAYLPDPSIEKISDILSMGEARRKAFFKKIGKMQEELLRTLLSKYGFPLRGDENILEGVNLLSDVEDVGFSVVADHGLTFQAIGTVGQLILKNRRELLSGRLMGLERVQQIVDKLEANHWYLLGEDPSLSDQGLMQILQISIPAVTLNALQAFNRYPKMEEMVSRFQRMHPTELRRSFLQFLDLIRKEQLGLKSKTEASASVEVDYYSVAQYVRKRLPALVMQKKFALYIPELQLDRGGNIINSNNDLRWVAFVRSVLLDAVEKSSAMTASVGFPAGIYGAKLEVYDLRDEVPERIAQRMAEILDFNNKLPGPKHTLFILPTGNTAIPVHEAFARIVNAKQIDCSRLMTANMDEYGDTHIYLEFMREHLFSKIEARGFKEDKDHVLFFNGKALDRKAELDRYIGVLEHMKSLAGGIDLQVGGIGVEAHVAFNEAPMVVYPDVNFEALLKDPTFEWWEKNEFELASAENIEAQMKKILEIRKKGRQGLEGYLKNKISEIFADTDEAKKLKSMIPLLIKDLQDQVVTFRVRGLKDVIVPEGVLEKLQGEYKHPIEIIDTEDVKNLKARVVYLSISTIIANLKDFVKLDRIPTWAFTEGLGTVVSAHETMIAAVGPGKARAIQKSVGKEDSGAPASILSKNNNVTFVTNKEAASLIDWGKFLKEEIRPFYIPSVEENLKRLDEDIPLAIENSKEVAEGHGDVEEARTQTRWKLSDIRLTLTEFKGMKTAQDLIALMNTQNPANDIISLYTKEAQINALLAKLEGETLNPDHFSAAMSTRMAKGQNSPAMVYNGGIDLNTSSPSMHWKISNDGRGVEMDVDPALIARIRRDGVDGLSAVILCMTPVTSIWPLVGLQAPA